MEILKQIHKDLLAGADWLDARGAMVFLTHPMEDSILPFLGFREDKTTDVGEWKFSGANIHVKADIEDTSIFLFFLSGKMVELNFDGLTVLEFLIALKNVGIPTKINYSTLKQNNVLTNHGDYFESERERRGDEKPVLGKKSVRTGEYTIEGNPVRESGESTTACAKQKA